MYTAPALDGEPSRGAILKTFAALIVVGFFLRIFYAGHLYQDDGLWLTAAEEILRGKALYREIYFDKPPALPIVYAALFKIFGAHILTIRLFTILYSVAVSAALYLFGSRLYGRRAGLVAAATFTVFSTTFTTGHVQGLNTDFLMTLPYTAGAYLLFRSRADSPRSAWLALGGGALVGVAFQVNPKAIFDLLFFAILLIFARKWAIEGAGTRVPAPLLLALAAAGFAGGSLPFLLYIAATESFSAYWLSVWDWGARYASYYPVWESAASALRQSLNYFALNNTLLVTLVFVITEVIRHARTKVASGANPTATRLFKADTVLLIWFAASYVGMATGGRFFGHYFFQIIPSLCLIGARGLMGIVSTLKARSKDPQGRLWSRAAFALLIAGFLFTLVRFHGRTIVLAADYVRGAKSEMTAEWFHEKLNREERMAAAAVKELPDGADGVDQMSSENMRATDGPANYLFVWGYRPEIYYWSGLVPASRYLSTQPLTGVPADVHYFGGEHGYLLEEDLTRRARAQLFEDLQQTQPKYIIDELGFFNSELSIQQVPELQEFMRDYKNIGTTARFIIYRKKDPSKKDQKRSRKLGK